MSIQVQALGMRKRCTDVAQGETFTTFIFLLSSCRINTASRVVTDFAQGETFTSFIFLLSSAGRAHDC